MPRRDLSRLTRLTALAALAAVLAGVGLHLAGLETAADSAWATTTAMLLIPLTISVVRSLLRRDVGVDAIALVSMAGALALGEYLAGAVVALMLAGGNGLEDSANRRARRELTALVERAPHVAVVRRGDTLTEIPIDDVQTGDIVLVRAGEVVPVDGLVEGDEAVVDESALTGEPLPVTVRRGGMVRSGTASVAVAFELRALRPAAESAYAALVRLVQHAGPNERRSSESPTAMRPSSCPQRALSPQSPGQSREILSAHSRSSLLRRRAR